MELDKTLLDDFAEITYDKKEKLQDVTCYGTAIVQDGNEYVRLDAADSLTPATFAVRAHHNDRVMVMIKNHRATVIANITTPSMTLGILNVTDGIIVQGYLTTNEARTAYDDQTKYGLTFSSGGIGAYGGAGKYWYVTNAGDLYASSATIVGNITATSGYLGSSSSGFTIDEWGIYSGTDRSSTTNGAIALANSNFTRVINDTGRTNLRFAIGSNFGVAEDGTLYTANADLSGKITATSGKIGKWNIGSISSTGQLDGSLYSGNFGSDGSIYLIPGGTTSSLSIAGRAGTDWVITSGSNFGVTKNGVLYTNGATVIGDVTATTLTATASGTIGPWSLNSASLYKAGGWKGTTAGSAYFGDNGISVLNKFYVDATGKLTATEVDISGAINATSGTIGSGTNKITIGTNSVNASIYYGMTSVSDTQHDGFYIGTDGIALGKGAFKVTNTGSFTATTGKIGPWDVNSSSIYRNSSTHGAANGLYFGTSGLSITDKFQVNSVGKLTATGADIGGKITADDGEIGGWKIGQAAIYRGTNATATSFDTEGSLYFGSLGLSLSDKFSVTATGALTATGVDISGTIKADLGEIGGFAIESNSIHTKDVLISSNADGSVGLSSSVFTRTIGGTSVSDLKFAIGNGFGVTKTGSIYGRSLIQLDTVDGAVRSNAGIKIVYMGNEIGAFVGAYPAGSTTYDSDYAEIRTWSLGNYYIIGNSIWLSGRNESIYVSPNISISRPLDSWVSTIKNPAINVTKTGTSGAVIGMTLPTNNGYIGIGTYPSSDDRLHVQYITSANYNAGTNTTTTAEIDAHCTKDLPLTGGTLTGTLYVGDTTTGTNRIVSCRNSTGAIELNCYTSKRGIYDRTSTKWVIATNGTNTTLEEGNVSVVNGSADVSGNVSVGKEAVVQRTVSVFNSTAQISLRVNSDGGNVGIHDDVTDEWIIRRDSSDLIYLGTTTRAATGAFSGVSVSGKRITFTRLNGDTTYIDTQDTTYTFSNKAATLAWGTSKTIATVGGTDITVSLPSNPNTTYSAGSGLTLSSTTFSLGGTITDQVTLTRSGDNNAIFAIQNAKSAVAVRCNSDGGAAGLRGIKTNNSTSGRDIWICYMDSSGTPKLGTASDRRDKNIYGLIDDGKALNVLRDVELVNFSYKTDPFGTIQNGVVAQQVRDVLIANDVGYRSYMCIESTDDGSIYYDLTTPEEKVHYSIDYSKFTPLLWKGWQIHDNEIETLKQQINELKAEISALKGAA